MDEVQILEKELDMVMDENDLLKQLLTNTLSEDDKLYIKIRYGVELGG